MTTEELQQLSRDAARKLPKEWFDNTGEGIRAPYHNYIVVKQLAFNTEACCEIFVRHLKGDWMYVYALMSRLIAEGVDEMQAFRTAVLRAVVAL